MNEKIKQLTELVAHLDEARACSRNLGRMYEYMHDDEKGRLVINFYRQSRDEARPCDGLSDCVIRWGDVYMTEDCYGMVYARDDEAHPLKFLCNYFYDRQQLWVLPERLSEKVLQNIIDWIYKTINY